MDILVSAKFVDLLFDWLKNVAYLQGNLKGCIIYHILMRYIVDKHGMEL